MPKSAEIVEVTIGSEKISKLLRLSRKTGISKVRLYLILQCPGDIMC